MEVDEKAVFMSARSGHSEQLHSSVVVVGRKFHTEISAHPSEECAGRV